MHTYQFFLNIFLTVHRSIILAINQLNAQNQDDARSIKRKMHKILFYNKFNM